MFDGAFKFIVSVATIATLAQSGCVCPPGSTSKNTYTIMMDDKQYPKNNLKTVTDRIVGVCYPANEFTYAQIYGQTKGFFQLYQDTMCMKYFSTANISKADEGTIADWIIVNNYSYYPAKSYMLMPKKL
ncbi:hypothetical protein AYI70_g2200 [Smittium culicis]|uniref:Uncharacterized protein n=1 Tax=Smittium culicis TaxID=133412 RepID=A0A1R1Y9E6_9FUNG|nr:hypothetical protein AYI70_g2200 [Smittium culicis]